MREHWENHGPPLNITALVIARALGADLLGPAKPEAHYGELEPTSGPSIAELAAKIKPPIAGGETLEASREVIKAMFASEPKGPRS